MVRTPDCDTDFFDIVTVVLQRDTLAPYMSIICLDYFKKGKKMISHRNFDRRRSSNAYRKYTSQSQIPAP